MLAKTLESQDLHKRASEAGKVSCKGLELAYSSLKEAKHATVNFRPKTSLGGEQGQVKKIHTSKKGSKILTLP